MARGPTHEPLYRRPQIGDSVGSRRGLLASLELRPGGLDGPQRLRGSSAPPAGGGCGYRLAAPGRYGRSLSGPSLSARVGGSFARPRMSCDAGKRPNRRVDRGRRCGDPSRRDSVGTFWDALRDVGGMSEGSVRYLGWTDRILTTWCRPGRRIGCGCVLIASVPAAKADPVSWRPG
jgi:hypothetical protein